MPYAVTTSQHAYAESASAKSAGAELSAEPSKRTAVLTAAAVPYAVTTSQHAYAESASAKSKRRAERQQCRTEPSSGSAVRSDDSARAM